MSRAKLIHNGVFRRLMATALQKFLQPGFRILEAVGIGQRVQFFGEQLHDNGTGCIKAPSRYMAPMMASMASARMDSRKNPPLLSLPAPSLRYSPSSSPE